MNTLMRNLPLPVPALADRALLSPVLNASRTQGPPLLAQGHSPLPPP